MDKLISEEYLRQKVTDLDLDQSNRTSIQLILKDAPDARDEDRIEKLKSEICDKYCKYPNILAQDRLDKKCDKCPLSRL